MKYRSEAEVKTALGIDSFRNLSKDKVLQFASMMPDLDTELALRIVEQFPAFKDFAADIYGEIRKAYEVSVESNGNSQTQTFDVFHKIIGIIEKELDRDLTSREDRRFLIEKLQEIAHMAYDKDSENKRFLETTFGKVVLAAGGVLVAGATVLGARFAADASSGSESDKGA